jgi:hypothetical protein
MEGKKEVEMIEEKSKRIKKVGESIR